MIGPVLALASLLLFLGCAARPPAGLAEGTPRAFSHTLTTSASPEAIWALWTEPHTWPQWDPELAGAELVGEWREGARGTLRPTSGPRARVTVTHVAERETTFSTKLPLASLRVTRRWEDAAEGRIRITHEVSFHGLAAGPLASRLGPGFRRALPRAMASLDALARTASP